MIKRGNVRETRRVRVRVRGDRFSSFLFPSNRKIGQKHTQTPVTDVARKVRRSVYIQSYNLHANLNFFFIYLALLIKSRIFAYIFQ